MTQAVTGKQALKALKTAVKLKGEDYVYPDSERSPLGTCQYSDGKEPLCIVGVALDSLGVNVHGQPNTAADSINVRWDGVHLTERAIRILRAAQVSQDVGDDWGKALDAAKTVA